MTYELPKTILERFLSKKFVILGRAGLDLYPNPIDKNKLTIVS